MLGMTLTQCSQYYKNNYIVCHDNDISFMYFDVWLIFNFGWGYNGEETYSDWHGEKKYSDHQSYELIPEKAVWRISRSRPLFQVKGKGEGEWQSGHYVQQDAKTSLCFKSVERKTRKHYKREKGNSEVSQYWIWSGLPFDQAETIHLVCWVYWRQIMKHKMGIFIQRYVDGSASWIHRL